MPTTEQGVPGVRQFSGYINEEWDRRLRTIRDSRLAKQQMQDDPTIAAALRAIDAFARSTDYQLDPADDAPPEVLGHVKDCLNAMDGSWGDKLSEIMSHIVYGFSLFEVVHDLDSNGMVVWKKWAPRGQETIDRWDFDAAGRDWLNAIQINPNGGNTFVLPRKHLLHFVTVSRKQSPEGQSLIRAAFNPWFKKEQHERFEGIGAERNMNGVPMMRIPTADYNNTAKQARWLQILTDMRVNEASGILIPSDVDPTTGAALYDFSLITAGSVSPFDSDKIIERYKTDMLRSLMADWMKLGDEGGGSYALGVSKASSFALFVQSILDSIADTITEQAIKPLCRYNGWTDEQAPTFRFERVQRKDVAMYADALVKLASGQLIEAGKAEVQTFVYELIGLPIPDEGFEDRVPLEPTEEEDDAMLDRVTGDNTDPNALQPGDVDKAKDDPKDKQFTEELKDDWIPDGQRAWDEIVPERYVGLLDAAVAE